MSSLYIDRKDIFIKFENDALVFYLQDKRIGTVPIAPLERIYIRGNAILTSQLLGQLGKKKISVVILSGRRGKVSLLLPCPHNDAKTRFIQYQWASDASKSLPLAQATVHAKLESQIKLLKKALEIRSTNRKALYYGIEKISDIKKKVFEKNDISSLRGLEGSSASLYFSAYGSLFPGEANFNGRNRRPPRDPVNACLSLSYTLLHAEAVIAAYGHGFDPYIGFLHELNFGRESLACDIVEPLRTEMDYFVWRLFAEQTIRPRDFTTEKDGSCMMGKSGREKFYKLVEQPLEQIRKKLESSLKNLRSYVEQHNHS